MMLLKRISLSHHLSMNIHNRIFGWECLCKWRIDWLWLFDKTISDTGNNSVAETGKKLFFFPVVKDLVRPDKSNWGKIEVWQLWVEWRVNLRQNWAPTGCDTHPPSHHITPPTIFNILTSSILLTQGGGVWQCAPWMKVRFPKKPDTDMSPLY